MTCIFSLDEIGAEADLLSGRDVVDVGVPGGRNVLPGIEN